MGEQGLLFSFRVFVHDGYYLAILVRFFHQGWLCKGNLGFSYFAPTRNGGTTDDFGRRFRCYQQDRSNLLLDHSVTRYRKWYLRWRDRSGSVQAWVRVVSSSSCFWISIFLIPLHTFPCFSFRVDSCSVLEFMDGLYIKLKVSWQRIFLWYKSETSIIMARQ